MRLVAKPRKGQDWASSSYRDWVSLEEDKLGWASVSWHPETGRRWPTSWRIGGYILRRASCLYCGGADTSTVAEVTGTIIEVEDNLLFVFRSNSSPFYVLDRGIRERR